MTHKMKDPFDIFYEEIEKKVKIIRKNISEQKKTQDDPKETLFLNSVFKNENSKILSEFIIKNTKIGYSDPLRKSHKIHVKNINKKKHENPSLIENFTDLKLTQTVYNTLCHKNMIKPTPIQMQIIPIFLDGYNVFGRSPTGTGKTLCFVLPLVLLRESTDFRGAVVLLPTRELCIQVEHVFKQFRSVIGIYGGSIGYLKNNIGNEIIVATPGRLLQILEKKNQIADFSHFIIDEFDKMTSKEFISNICKIHSFMNSPQICVLAATLSDISSLKYFNFDYEVFIEDRNMINKNITQKVFCSEDKFKTLTSLIRRNTLIFTNTKDQADDLVVHLQDFFNIRKQNENVYFTLDSLHGSKSQIDRNQILKDFHERKIDVLICTGLMSRGIDFKTDFIINYNIPETLDDYIHQIGRTGRLRLGIFRPGIAHTLISKKDIEKNTIFEKFWNDNRIEIKYIN